MTTCHSKSTNSSTVKLSHTNSLVCDFEIFTQRFRLTTVVELLQQLYFIAGFGVCLRSPTAAPKGYGKFSNLCTEHCPLEYIKTYSRVFI